MKKGKYFENYPFWIVFLSNIVPIAIYLISAFIIYQIGIIWLVLYILLILFFEFKLISKHCINCYYYGKTCAFGKGRISKLFFKKGDPNRFCKMKITWKDILPDFLMSLIPAIIGIILLIKDFNWAILLSVIILFILTFSGNAIIRSKLACKYCKQKEIGCPAQKLFEKKD